MCLKKKIIENRNKEVELNFNLYKDFIKPNDTIIDVGCGDGSAAFLINNKFGAEVVCVDKDPSYFKYRDNLKLIIADGEKLPFKDNFFNTGLLFYTLHHCQNPDKVLKETIRITKNNLVIIEEFYKSSLNKQVMKIYDYIINQILYPGSHPVVNFFKEDNFLKITSNLGLRLQKNYSLEKKGRPSHKKLFIFKK